MQIPPLKHPRLEDGSTVIPAHSIEDKSRISHLYFSEVPGESPLYVQKKVSANAILYKCHCLILRSQAKRKGVTNLWSHIQAEHAQLEELPILIRKRGYQPDDNILPSDKFHQVFGWIDLVLASGREFSFVEDKKSTFASKLC
ncbi:hypothetical protein RCL1_001365 [Eukaryota sp. TZLM3-RCL]